MEDLGEMNREEGWNSSLIPDRRNDLCKSGYPQWVVDVFSKYFNNYNSGYKASDDVKIIDLKEALFQAIVLYGVDREDAFKYFEGLVQRLIQEFLREELLSILEDGDDAVQLDRAQKAHKALNRLHVRIEK